MFTEAIFFGQLLSGLSDKYSTICKIIDSQPSLLIQEKLNILRNREDRLATDKALKAFAAWSTVQYYSRSKHQSRPDSGSESESSQYRLICWACKAYRYLVQDCPTVSQLQTAIKKLSSANLQIEKTKHRDSSSGQSAKGKTKPVKDKKTSANTSCYCYKGHVAGNNLSDTDTESSGSDSEKSDKNKIEEVAAYSQDLGKVSSSL